MAQKRHLTPEKELLNLIESGHEKRMDHKKIYDHLADIYLDSPSETKKEEPDSTLIEEESKGNIYKRLFLISIAAVVGLFVFFALNRNHRTAFESSFVLAPEAVKVDFSFEPAQKSVYLLRLENVDVSQFRTLKFLAKTENPKDDIYLRLELNNSHNERSEVYISALPGKWKDYIIDLADFRKITDWTTITTLSFILEEWNSSQDRGIIYFDNVRLVK